MSTYLLLKALHVLGVILFLGNILDTAWWKTMADRSGDPRVIAFAQRQVSVTDWVFTGGGSLLLFATGLGAAWAQGFDIIGSAWLLWGLILFGLSGGIWAIVLIPAQNRQAKLARQFADGGDIPDEYRRLCRRWNLWGSIATLLPLAAVGLMVFKPV